MELAELVFTLGPTATSLAAGADSRASLLWAGGAQEIPEEAVPRLKAAAKAFEIARARGDDAARLWFISEDPRLEDSPMLAIRDGRFGEVRAAAHLMAY